MLAAPVIAEAQAAIGASVAPSSGKACGASPSTKGNSAGRGMYRGMPYGQFCPGPRMRPYGAPRPVKTADEAKELCQSYYMGCGQHLRCGKVEEESLYFEAEVLAPNGAVIDRVIIDKRTGRIRSIY